MSSIDLEQVISIIYVFERRLWLYHYMNTACIRYINLNKLELIIIECDQVHTLIPALS